jgi:type VI secretion system secreted protein VgrG
VLPIHIELDCGALPDDLWVVSAVGLEAFNSLTCWRVEAVTTSPLDLDAVIGAPATLQVRDEGEGSARSIGLIVGNVVHAPEHGDEDHYALELVPNEWLLTLRSGYRVFLEKTAPEMIGEVLKDAGIAPDRVRWRLSGTYAAREQCVMYGETEWSFIERLLADEGISYFFDFQGDKALIVFADDPSSHDTIDAPTQIPLDEGADLRAARSFSALEISEEVASDAVHVRDFDARHPDVFIEGKAGDGSKELFEYPACVPNEETAARRARVRLEQLQRMKRSARAWGSCARVQAGRLLDVVGATDDAMNRSYLVVEVRHRWVASTALQEGAAPYTNEVVMVPGREAPFRPAAPLSRPRVEGLEVAITTGPAGSEIHVDDLGQLKVRFPWDRSGIADDRSSAWVRNVQMQMGASMLLPRVGWEVAVAYFDGNPDRPISLGRVYNAESVAPYSLPAASATSTIQSATSPGGGSTNEIRIKDGAGAQEMFLHASRDQSVSVGGSAVTKVSANETHDVGLSLGVAIHGSQTVTVGGSQTVNVVMDYATTLDGARSELIGGVEMTKVTANRLVDSKGAYLEVIGGLYGLQCNQANTDVKGAFLQMIGGAFAEGCALGSSESVAGARSESVAGAKNITAASGYSEMIIGPKKIQAGASSASAGGKVATVSKTGSGTLNVGASAKLKAGGPFVITSKEITIEVGGPLKAGALEISGGTLKPKKGTAKLIGAIKRRGGSKIE